MDAKVARFWFWVLLGSIGLIAVGLHWSDDGKPHYVSIADSQTQHCMWTKGDHRWRGSSGMTLEAYCELDGTLKATEKLCYDQPEYC